MLRAGAHAQDITPPKFPVPVNGSMTDHQATAAHDPLYARCIVLKNAETALAIVVCDSCAIPRELMDRAKSIASTKTGIPISHILISATHAHSCPAVTATFQTEPDKVYTEFLVEQIAQGIERANNQVEPARVGWGSVEQKNLLFNRRWYVKQVDKPDDKPNEKKGLRSNEKSSAKTFGKNNLKSDEKSEETVENPFGTKSDRIITNPGYSNPQVSGSVNLIDPELSFLSIQSLDRRPIALLANYSLHYIGGVPADVVSADYFGEFSQRIARQLNATDVQPPFVGVMSNGTSGDVNNLDFRMSSAQKREDFEQISYAAELLTQDIGRAYEKIEHYSSLPLKMRESEIVLGVRKPIEDEVLVAERKLATVTQRPLTELPLIYARETTLLAQYPTSVKVKVQAIRIGSLGIASSPCETFTATGLEIKKGSPFKSTFTISLANGYNGYLPTPEQMVLGGYETWRARSSYLSVDSEPKILSTIDRLLSEVSK